MKPTVSGVITPVLTPFDKDGNVDVGRLREFLDFQVESGVAGLMMIGGSGEFVSLTDAERKTVLKAAVDHVGDRLPVYAGLLAPDTTYTLELARYARDVGAAGLLALTPYYIKPSVDGIVWHFEQVAEASGNLPIILYNNPGRTGLPIDVALLKRLVSIPGCIGIKDCDRDLASLSAKITAVGDQIAVLSGEDDLFFPTLALGSPGGIVAIANIAPKEVVAMCNAARAGNMDGALEWHNRLLPIIQAFYRVNHPAPLKAAARLVGWDMGEARLPLWPPTDEEREQLRHALENLKQ